MRSCKNRKSVVHDAEEKKKQKQGRQNNNNSNNVNNTAPQHDVWQIRKGNNNKLRNTTWQRKRGRKNEKHNSSTIVRREEETTRIVQLGEKKNNSNWDGNKQTKMLFTMKRGKKRRTNQNLKKNTQFTTNREYTYICEQGAPFAGRTKK